MSLCRTLDTSVAVDPAFATRMCTLACAGLTAFSALRKIDLEKGQPLLLIGAGGVGWSALHIAQRLGVTELLVADTDPRKRQAISSLVAAERLVDNGDPHAVEHVNDVSRGGVGTVIDFVGNDRTSAFALQILRKGGILVNVGLHGGQLGISLPAVTFRQLTLKGSYVGSLQELHELVALVACDGQAPVPVIERPLNMAEETVVALGAGDFVGRPVLVPARSQG